MRVALVNPPWSFEGSIYFGCRAPHLPLEFGYTRALLEASGHEATIIDGQLDGLSLGEACRRVEAFAPEMVVVTSAPSYLFWRCAPPELRVPQQVVRELAPLKRAGALFVAVGPHASTTPRATLRKLGVDAVVLGECEEIVRQLADRGADAGTWGGISSLAYNHRGFERVQGGPHASDMAALPALRWGAAALAKHTHHHHRFERPPEGPGAELEASRGCPYHCTFCAKDNFRDAYRKRPLATVLEELDGLVADGARYVYFVDEIFLPDRALLEALVQRDVVFGVQMRIDNWSRDTLDLLGRAGCVSIEAGVESISPEGRARLAKRCKLTTSELSDLLVHAKQSVPFVQANLLDSTDDDPAEVASWRDDLRARGVWANDPVPLFPYPGSPEYTRRWGTADDHAWERAHADYLSHFDHFSDIQERRPRALDELEGGHDAH